MRKNRLITDQQRDKYKASQGKPYPEERGSGRTTGLALKHIGEAMCLPGIERVIFDDHVKDENNDQAIAILAKDIVKKLGLKFFIFDNFKGRYFIRYEVFE